MPPVKMLSYTIIAAKFLQVFRQAYTVLKNKYRRTF